MSDKPFSWWYIKKKYNNLEDEILNNNIHQLNKKQFTQNVMQKAKTLIETRKAKNIKADTFLFGRRYGFEEGSLITEEHLMSLILYCSFTDLSFEFTKTFRKITKAENIQSCKQRNREYWNWSKLLVETVNIFCEEQRGWESKKIYYHGVSLLNFGSLRGHFSSPTSTSAQIEVATIFAGDTGIIIELKPRQTMSFNCGWISSFSNEDEYLYFQTFYPLSIVSIRLTLNGKNVNYKWYINAVAKFDAGINGEDYEGFKHKIIDEIINNLVNDNCESYPVYIMKIFKQICKTQTKINIKYYYLDDCMRSLFFDSRSEYKYCPLINKIYSLFPNCNHIYINYNGDYPNISSIFVEEYLNDILLFLKETKGIITLDFVNSTFKHNYKHLSIKIEKEYDDFFEYSEKLSISFVI